MYLNEMGEDTLLQLVHMFRNHYYYYRVTRFSIISIPVLFFIDVTTENFYSHKYVDGKGRRFPQTLLFNSLNSFRIICPQHKFLNIYCFD